MTELEKVIDSLLDQARDKDLLANGDESSIFTEDAKYLRTAADLLKAQRPIEARLNLCDSCKQNFEGCSAKGDDVTFGSDTGNDNVIGCREYVNRWKSRKPRVLTLEELMGFDGAFLIEYNPSILSREANWAMLHYMDEKQVHIWRPRLVEHYAIAQYGVTWRCWTSRPTDEQREATPWEK